MPRSSQLYPHPLLSQTKLSARDKGGLGAKWSTWKITYLPPALRSHRSGRKKVDRALCFSALGLYNLNFNSGERVVDTAVESSQTQLELSGFSGILQIGDLPHLFSSETKTVLAHPQSFQVTICCSVFCHFWSCLFSPHQTFIRFAPNKKILSEPGAALSYLGNMESKEAGTWINKTLMPPCFLFFPWHFASDWKVVGVSCKWPWAFVQVMSWIRNMGRRAICIEFRCLQSGKLGLWGCRGNPICLWNKRGKCREGKVIPGIWLETQASGT